MFLEGVGNLLCYLYVFYFIGLKMKENFWDEGRMFVN